MEYYIVEIILDDGSKRYMGHDTYYFNEHPDHHSILETMSNAKAKRTKILKSNKNWIDHGAVDVYKETVWGHIKEVKIRKVGIVLGDYIE